MLLIKPFVVCVHVQGLLGLALGVPDWDVDFDPGADITLLSEGGQAIASGLIQRGKSVDTGDGDLGGAAGFGVGDP